MGNYIFNQFVCFLSLETNIKKNKKTDLAIVVSKGYIFLVVCCLWYQTKIVDRYINNDFKKYESEISRKPIKLDYNPSDLKECFLGKSKNI